MSFLYEIVFKRNFWSQPNRLNKVEFDALFWLKPEIRKVGFNIYPFTGDNSPLMMYDVIITVSEIVYLGFIAIRDINLICGQRYQVSLRSRRATSVTDDDKSIKNPVDRINGKLKLDLLQNFASTMNFIVVTFDEI